VCVDVRVLDGVLQMQMQMQRCRASVTSGRGGARPGGKDDRGGEGAEYALA
jgi:hypothetical protein